ncbi:hypothetical protein Tco_0522516 [Tanacetum coccineum]
MITNPLSNLEEGVYMLNTNGFLPWISTAGLGITGAFRPIHVDPACSSLLCDLDLEPLTLAFDFAHTLHLLESLLSISLDRLDIFEGRIIVYPSLAEIQRVSLTGFPAQSVGSSNTYVLDLPCLLVLITGTSQSRQHVDTSSIHIESRKSPTAVLFDDDTGRISIRHYSFVRTQVLLEFQNLVPISPNKILKTCSSGRALVNMSATWYGECVRVAEIAMDDMRITLQRYFVVGVKPNLEAVSAATLLEQQLEINDTYSASADDSAVKISKVVLADSDKNPSWGLDRLQVVVLFALSWMDFHELELMGDLSSIGVDGSDNRNDDCSVLSIACGCELQPKRIKGSLEAESIRVLLRGLLTLVLWSYSVDVEAAED